MPDFEIKIRTDLDGKGLKESNAEFEANRKEVAAANEELKKTVGAHGDAGEAAKKSGNEHVEIAEKETLGEREKREAVRGVGEAIGAQIPVIGLWMNQSTAALAAVLTAVEILKRGWEYLRQPIEEANAAINAIDDAKIKSAAASAQTLATDMGDIANKESSLQAAFQTGNTALEDRVKLYGQQKDAIVKIAEAQEKAFEAQLDFDSHLHPENKSSNDNAKQSAQLQLDSLRGSTDAAKLQYEIQQRQTEFTNARLRLQSQDPNAIANADRAAAGPEAALAAAQAGLENTQKAVVHHGIFGDLNLDQAKDKLRELQEILRTVKPNDSNSDILLNDKYRAQQLAQEIAAHDTAVSTAQDKVTAAKVAADAAKQAVDNAKAQEEADQKLSIEGEARIIQLQQQLNLLNQINAATAQARADEAGARDASRNITDVETAVHAGESAYHAATASGQTLAQLKQHIAALVQIIKDLAALHTGAQDVGTNLADEVAELKKEVAQLQQRGNYGAYPH